MSKVTVEVKHPNFANFLRTSHSEALIAVAELTDEQAAALWDSWKVEWLKHVAKRREAAKIDNFTIDPNSYKPL